MRRFIMLTIIIFGFLLSYQTLRIMSQQRYIADVNVNQFKDRVVRIKSTDIFAEKNVIDTFKKRYKADIQFSFENRDEKFLSTNLSDSDIAIYPSFAYESIKKRTNLFSIEQSKVPNMDKLMEYHLDYSKNLYSDKNSIYAIPIAYIPYAIFFNIEKVKPSTVGKDFFSKNLKIAISDDYGAFLALSKFMGISFNSSMVKAMHNIFNKKNTVFFNLDNLEESLSVLMDSKPDVIVAPSYLKSFFERRVGSLEMLLPDEGTFATLYIASVVNEKEKELYYIFLNHLIDPLIQKNYTDTFTLPITNKASLNTMSAVLYNSLKLNDPEYFKRIMILKNENEYKTAVSLYKSFKEGL